MDKVPIIGATYRFEDDEDSIFRIIELDSENIFYVELNKKQISLPLRMENSVFRDDLTAEVIIETRDPYEHYQKESSFSLKQLEKRDRRWKIVNEIWSDPERRNLFLIKAYRKQGFDLLADELDITSQQAKRIMTNFWQKGMNPNSLLPQYQRRGTGLQKQGSKRGRKGSSDVGLDEDLRSKYEKVYQRYYLSGKKSLQDTYDELLKRYFQNCITVDENEKVKIINKGNCPTISQFYYWHSTRKNPEEEFKKRNGVKPFNNNVRVVHGSSRDQVDGPGSRYELDLTHLNIAVVSRFDRSKVIGYPRLFILVDVYSRMVAGLVVSMEEESNFLGLKAIYNCAEDKVKFAQRYNVEISEDDWPAHFLPQRILYDNGNFKNSLQEYFKKDKKIHFEYSPSYTPTSKSTVERKHQSYKEFISNNLPGAIKSHTHQRGEHDTRLEAALTLDELTAILIRLTVAFNKTPIQELELDPEMTLAGFKATPNDLWKWGILNGYGSLKQVTNLEGLWHSLLPREYRTISRKGVRFKNHYYVGADEATRHLLNNNVKKRMEFCYNPTDVTEAYICVNDEYYPLQLRVKDSYRFERLEESEMDLIESVKRKSKHADRVLKAFEWSDLKDDVNEIVKEAQAKTPKHKRSDLKNIRQNKKEYLEQEKEEEMGKRKNQSQKGGKVKESRESFSELRRKYLIQETNIALDEEDLNE